MRAPRSMAMLCALMLAPALVSLTGSTAKAAPPPKPKDSCGAVVTKPSGAAWQCTLAEEFNGKSLNRNLWVPQTNTPVGTEAVAACLTDSPDNISVSGGSLRLTVRKRATSINCGGVQAEYTSGQVSTFWKWSQQYGRFEARMKSPVASAPGLTEAFWLWPDARVSSDVSWPAAGEIDVVETYSAYPGIAVPFLHYTANDNGGPKPGINTAWDCPAERGVFNTYVLEWTPAELRIIVNGRVCLVNTSADPAFAKPYIMVLTQALGATGNVYAGGTPLPATMEVDYVKVWR